MWFIPALIAVFAWGTADLFYKIGNNEKDPNSAIKTTIMVGLVMGIHAIFYYGFYEGITFHPAYLITYLPVSSMYILSMAIGYVGLRYIELSISSPISNSSGAVSAMLTFLILGTKMVWIQFVAVAVISAAIFMLSYFEKQEADKEIAKSGEVVEKKYRISAVAIIFPILYCVIDGLGTFLDGYYLDYAKILPESEANMTYEITFLMVALILLVYLRVVKKEKMSLFNEKVKGMAAIFETAGQFFYVGAIASNAIVVAPMIASYSIVSVIWSRIFLKEKLSNKQYVMILAIIISIAVLGFYDG
ncbi:EamA family transporter [Vagococcus fluvialis]|uniref:EamA family transporter n=1 Tax=Vagococcus fluvialis TaxID=2738 RepID=UPI001D0A7F49|nr:EamA family transporter [Vagococcus fluvialis]UDM80813.1 EamA family transporter [Vagococcus fluvialis]